MKAANIRFILTALVSSLSLTNIHAQIYNNDAYLKNDYIQMAISPQGVYGAEGGTAPIHLGYFAPDNSYGYLGFITSPNNSWPDYYGDFIIPGIPYEGFSVVFREAGTRMFYANTRCGGVGGVDGPIIPRSPDFTYHSDTGSGVYDDLTWHGEISGYLNIDCRFQLVGTRVVHYTTITNISGGTLTDIYFARGMDPDQENGANASTLPPDCNETTDTYNIIESQADGTPGKYSWVVANGFCNPSAISYYCEDLNSRVAVSEYWYELIIEPENAYPGGNPPPSLYLNEGEYSRIDARDWTIELAIFVGDLGPGASVTLTHDVRVDQPPVVIFDNPLTLTENEGGTFTYYLIRQDQLDETVNATVRLTGVSGATAADFVGIPSLPHDYNLVFGPYETSKTITIYAANDCHADDYETFELEIIAVTSPMGGLMTIPNIAEGTIRDMPPLPGMLPSATITASPSTVCYGGASTLTAAASGATTPSMTYTWNRNGVSMGTTTVNTYNASGLTATANYSITLLTEGGCSTTSAPVTITITTSVTPAATITASDNNICSGTSITYTVINTANGGTTPAYQWQVNGSPVVGETGSTFTYVPDNGDIISCVLTSNDPCASPTQATSNTVAMIVTPTVIPSATISVAPD